MSLLAPSAKMYIFVQLLIKQMNTKARMHAISKDSFEVVDS